MVSRLQRAFSEAIRRLWQHIERFPIPLEDALWIIEAYGDVEAARYALALKDRRRLSA